MKARCGRGENSAVASAALGCTLLALALASNAGSAATGMTSFTVVSTTRMDLNQATRAEIEAVRGVGVELTQRLLAAREEEPFQDWGEARKRVKGLGKRALAGFAEAGFHIKNQPPPSP
jgi:competence protein ComEA